MGIVFKFIFLFITFSLSHSTPASNLPPPSDPKKTISEAEWIKLISRSIGQSDADIIALYAYGGDVYAQVNLGNFYYHGHDGISSDLEKSLFWFSKAAENNEESGLAMAASMHFSGEGTPINKLKALEYRKISAALGFKDGLFELGRAYSETSRYGLPVDDVKATDFFKQAALTGLARGKSKYGQRLYDGIGIAKDECEGLKWLEQAARHYVREAIVKISTVGNGPCVRGSTPQPTGR